ncbi:hypothetical protein DPMN_004095 [Dreissena polymorpha]|uniref:Uncharacterized protein n=1 Tax=Dreissena polymorpha TaxID=45954 RepID=A0A9D4RVB8_DREPO|nr:hypothetical protein DPMN_004095 [Dreissena polymorpha]
MNLYFLFRCYSVATPAATITPTSVDIPAADPEAPTKLGEVAPLAIDGALMSL